MPMFATCYCISLDRRPDRWAAFQSRIGDDWPFAWPERFKAIDGERLAPPSWWNGSRAAWGCRCSHLRVIEQCLNDGLDSVLILEDDATFAPDFANRAVEFMQHVPPGWHQIYLGGHRGAHPAKAVTVNEHVVRPSCVNLGHCYGLSSEGMREVYRHLCEPTKEKYQDRHLWSLHGREGFNVFCPPTWIVGQAAGRSDLSGKVREQDAYFNAKATEASTS